MKISPRGMFKLNDDIFFCNFLELLPRGSIGPDMVVGGEPWHRALPADWVPIIARDIQRQAEQGEQVPLCLILVID
jgi:hypothetical protein